ncbi:hypothetical protein TNCV_2637981 [Trichonephila clavipes]|nr:hypothetical protein TNCV_2637981 [Trichonephila clavipes]
MFDYSRLQLKSRQQKVSETLQELATDVERLSHLAFSDCPTEKADGRRLLKRWTCGREGHLQRALARQGAEMSNSASRKEVSKN